MQTDIGCTGWRYLHVDISTLNATSYHVQQHKIVEICIFQHRPILNRFDTSRPFINSREIS